MIRTLHLSTLTCATFAILTVTAISGCGPKEDLNKAKSVVETALNSWKNGEKAQQLAAQNIEIVDDDWKSGAKLLDFDIKSTTSQPQQGPRVVVQLSLKLRNGKKLDSEIAYEVRMSEKVTISRDPFHVPVAK